MEAATAQRLRGLVQVERDRRNAAEAEVRFADRVSGIADRAGGIDRSDVEAGSLGDLLEVDAGGGRVSESHLGEQFAGSQVHLLVAAVELLEGNGPLGAAFFQHDTRIQGQQQRREVADRGSVDDVAGQGGTVADLPGGDQVIERCNGGNRRDHRGMGAELLEGGEGANTELATDLADPFQLRTAAQYVDAPLGDRLAPLYVQVRATGDE